LAYSYPEIKQFKGLFLQANSFNVPDGAMEEALNVVINQDDIVAKIRGNYQYYTSSDIISNLFLYQGILVGVLSNRASKWADVGSEPNVTGTRTDYTGASFTVTAPRKSRSVQANKNLYFTADQGVMKLEGAAGNIFQAGVPSGLDLRGLTYPDTGAGVIDADSQVSYRILFGRRDANDNLLLSAPSERFYYANPNYLGVTINVAATVATITGTTAFDVVVGQEITLSSTGPLALDGPWVVASVTSPTVFTITVPSAVASGTGDVAITRKVFLQASIPQGISSGQGYFVQIYRTSPSVGATVVPPTDWALIDEVVLDSASISAKIFNYIDEIDDIFRAQSELLYTNPNSREGEAGANLRPPLCEDVTYYKDHVIFGNCSTRHRLDLAVVSASAGNNGDTVTFRVTGTGDQVYKARTGEGNTLRSSFQVSIAGTTATVTTGSTNGFVVGDTVYVAGAITTGNPIPDGTYTLTAVSGTTIEFTIPSGVTTCAWLSYQGVKDVSNNKLFTLSRIAGTVALNIAATARGLVTAVNRDTASVIESMYTSGEDDVPGKFYVVGINFVGVIYAAASTASMGEVFAPTLPTSFASGTQVYSTNDAQPNSFYASKYLEPEAVPLPNFFPVGSKNAALQRVVALRDSLIVIKEDGIFRVTGQSPETYDITALDNTVFCIAADSVALINNQIYLISNQGVVRISENSVEILSRRIEEVIMPVIGKTGVAAQITGAGYETDRTYRICMPGPQDSVRSVTYIFNVLNNTWTTTDQLFSVAVVGPLDKLFTSNSLTIKRERKNQDRTDFCGQNYATTVNSVDSDLKGAVITSAVGTPMSGDVLELGGSFSRITTVTQLGASLYAVRFARVTALVATNTPILYAAYTARVKMAPIHAGTVGRSKQFAQMQLHSRTPSITFLGITFINAQFGGSEEVDWDGTLVNTGGGWGNDPWGFFGWGNQDGIANVYSTQPSPVVRIYIPLFAQRTTYLQPIIEHTQAGEAIEIQAMTFAVRQYNERVSR